MREEEVAEAGPGEFGVGAGARVGDGDGDGHGDGLPAVRQHGDGHSLAGAGLHPEGGFEVDGDHFGVVLKVVFKFFSTDNIKRLLFVISCNLGPNPV